MTFAWDFEKITKNGSFEFDEDGRKMRGVREIQYFEKFKIKAEKFTISDSKTSMISMKMVR